MSRTKLGLQVAVKGVGLAASTGLAASAISGEYGYFYIKIDSATGATGTMNIKNTDGETVNSVAYNLTDEWYPEPIQEILGGTVTGITYGVAF